MPDSPIELYSMDRQRLWGRDAFANDLFNEFRAGCTIFGLEGVTGAGKSEFLIQFSNKLQSERGPNPIVLRGGDAQTEALLIASFYKALTEVPRASEQRFEEAATKFVAQLPNAARLLAGSLIKDLAKAARLEKTIEQLADLVAGKDTTDEPYATLLDLDRDNQRMLFSKALAFVTDLGNPMCLVVDDYELLDASAERFLRALLRSKPENCLLLMAANTEEISGSNWQSLMKIEIQKERGSVSLLPELDTGSLAEWYEAELGVRPNPTEIESVMQASSGGRPKYVELVLKALRNKDAAPRVLNVSEIVRAMRSDLSADARLVGELLAMLPGDATVPIDLLALAARAQGSDFGKAIDELVASGLCERTGRRVNFLHSSYAAQWFVDIDLQQRDVLKDIWYDAFVQIGYVSQDYSTSGLVPLLATRIVERQTSKEVGELAEALRGLGATEDGLLLLDKSWSGDGDKGDA